MASSLYGRIGGMPACRELSVAFYARVARDPVLRPLFPGKSFTCAIAQFSAFLAQFLGGPAEDARDRWSLSLRESHARFQIGPEERTAWLKNMVQALDEVAIAEPLRTELLAFFERSSAYLVNHGERPAPGGKDPGTEISRRWDAQTRLDEAVAAIDSGDAGRAISLAGSSPHSGLLALMIRSRDEVLLAYVRESVTRHPHLIHEPIRHGRTLLHEAAAAGSLSVAELLLTAGAEPDARDFGGHTPLYCLANECEAKGSGSVVHTLVRAGADVNARDIAKRCTPLHMAARRGHVETAATLLDCGATIEAPDSLGDTPLRRAVNCGKLELAALLLARGADVLSRGSKGVTPLLAARTAAMKKLLQSA